jgi:hypothetical protein
MGNRATRTAVVVAGIAVAVLAALETYWHTPASAHGWYPKDCCNDMDCAPVVSISSFVPIRGGPRQLAVTSKHGTAVVPHNLPVRPSRDNRFHVCMRYDAFGDLQVVCFFVPASV